MRFNILIASAVSGNIVLEGMPEGSEEKFMVHADTLWDANNPEPLLCPNNACYQLDKEKRICQFNQHCAKVECGPGTSGTFLLKSGPSSTFFDPYLEKVFQISHSEVSFKFKNDLLFDDMHRLHGKEQTDLDKLFFFETENGWMHSCKNGTISKGKFGDDYDFEFKASKENGCYVLRRNNDGLFGHFTIAGSNVIASAGIEVGKKLKYSFNCPLDDLQEGFHYLYLYANCTLENATCNRK